MDEGRLIQESGDETEIGRPGRGPGLEYRCKECVGTTRWKHEGDVYKAITPGILF